MLIFRFNSKSPTFNDLKFHGAKRHNATLADDVALYEVRSSSSSSYANAPLPRATTGDYDRMPAPMSIYEGGSLTTTTTATGNGKRSANSDYMTPPAPSTNEMIYRNPSYMTQPAPSTNKYRY